VAEEKLHRVIVLLQVLVKLWDHQSNQFSQVLQVLVNVVVGWRAHENVALHESDEAPESLRFVLQFAKDGGEEIAHALCVANEEENGENR
jgi:hypothetical protein